MQRRTLLALLSLTAIKGCNMERMWPVDMVQSGKGRAATKGFEGCILSAYHDAGGVGSIGYGHTGGVRDGERITIAQADQLYLTDIKFCETAVKRNVNVQLYQSEFDALVDFVYNVGEAKFERSDVLHYLLRSDYQGCALRFMGWVHDAKHRVEPGLMRRNRWRELCFKEPQNW